VFIVISFSRARAQVLSPPSRFQDDPQQRNQQKGKVNMDACLFWRWFDDLSPVSLSGQASCGGWLPRARWRMLRAAPARAWMKSTFPIEAMAD
jgi:hypothetical protein